MFIFKHYTNQGVVRTFSGEEYEVGPETILVGHEGSSPSKQVVAIQVRDDLRRIIVLQEGEMLYVMNEDGDTIDRL